MATPIHRTNPASSYFVTTRCWQGRPVFQVAEIAEIMVKTLFEYRDRDVVLLHEFVVMPDHLHLLLTPGMNVSLERTMQFIKGGSSHRIHKARSQKMHIWQEGFFDWTMRDINDWRAKVQYIQMNPVRARLVERPKDWRYSSANPAFALDAMPKRFANITSGAKAPYFSHGVTPGLKPRPPKKEVRDAASGARRRNLEEKGATRFESQSGKRP